MLYMRLLKCKGDTHSIIDLEATHQYLRLLEGTLTFHAQVLGNFENSYTLLDVHNISEKLELAHAHYEASITFKASTSTSCTNQIITFFL